MYKKLDSQSCVEIINNFNDGINKNILSKKYEVSYGTITDIINRNGRIRIKPNSKYSVNENFFEKIDNEEKSYWLGFMYADGYIIENNRKIYSGLGLKDFDHLEKFNLSTESSYPIKKSITVNNFHVDIFNKTFTENLIKQGCTPRKTHTIKFPNLDTNLINHFIRGFFDGDGSITCTENCLQITICCSVKIFLEKIIEEFSKKIVFNRMPKLYQNKTGLYLFINSSGEDIIKIYDYLYHDSNIYLDRKKETFNHIINNIDEIKKIIGKNNWKKRKIRENKKYEKN